MFKDELNEQQYAAVSSGDGMSLVIAGAGAGKTRTLIYRVAWLLAHGIPPEEILLLTFTNKAAREMMSRVAQLTGSSTYRLWGGTFHSIALRMLSAHADRVGFKNKDLMVLDRTDTEKLLEMCLKEYGDKSKLEGLPSVKKLLNFFSEAINFSKSMEELMEEKERAFWLNRDEILEIWELFRKRKQSQNMMDFDDLLLLGVKLFRENPDILELYRQRFRYILVDEFQDTNRLQYEFVELLAGENGNLMVVGDDAQSIYSWRGACYNNILDFPTVHSDAHQYMIETNYRSTEAILNVANASIAHNTKQFQKKLRSVHVGGQMPIYVQCDDVYVQSSYIVEQIRSLRDEGVPLSEIAVLYRAHFHSMELQMALRRASIPFSVTSGVRFFEQAHIKDVASFLRIAYSPADELAFRRIITQLPGVGNMTATKMWRKFSGLNKEGEYDWPESLSAGFDRLSAIIPAKARQEWETLYRVICDIDPTKNNYSVGDMIRAVMEGFERSWMLEQYEDAANRLEDVEQFALFADDFGQERDFERGEQPSEGEMGGLTDFLSQMALMTNVEMGEAGESAGESVMLSTVHQAKGLEFRAVFVIMLCDELFPLLRGEEDRMEEERRLFYVAVTRAREFLFLISPRGRYIGGNGESYAESQFVREIPKELLDVLDVRT